MNNKRQSYTLEFRPVHFGYSITNEYGLVEYCYDLKRIIHVTNNKLLQEKIQLLILNNISIRIILGKIFEEQVNYALLIHNFGYSITNENGLVEYYYDLIKIMINSWGNKLLQGNIQYLIKRNITIRIILGKIFEEQVNYALLIHNFGYSINDNGIVEHYYNLEKMNSYFIGHNMLQANIQRLILNNLQICIIEDDIFENQVNDALELFDTILELTNF